ncbi:hypothetical protein EJ072_10955 [Mesorhizobium sp. M2A.F.Ca.ET.046.03.2.1]|nr:hypothetical protein EJ072_10955 [Mesorhizobium sp. M2A.F.Ca.ET.046.03.2.1]
MRGPLSVLPDISPSGGEIGCPFGFRQSPTCQNWRGRETADLPLEGEMSGRTERGAKDRGLSHDRPQHAVAP